MSEPIVTISGQRVYPRGQAPEVRRRPHAPATRERSRPAISH